MAIESLDVIRGKDDIDAIGELMDLMGLYVRTNFYNNIHDYIDRKSIDDGGISGGAQVIMNYLYRVKRPVSVSHIAKRLMINNISRFIGALEEKGFVERNFGKKDKRVVEVSISQKGKEFMDEYYSKYDAAAKEFMSEVLTEKERYEMKNLLINLVEMLGKIPSRIEESEKVILEMRGEKVDLEEELK